MAQHAVPPQKNPTIVWQKNSQQLRAPASTQKLLTALAAKLYLPSAFTFNTDIELSTNKAKQDSSFALTATLSLAGKISRPC
ncbi:D-alanyl-D-alanine carboxypeptidase [Photobacterium sanguinicancri]|uniref:D-alanyl-D-alanine carboxypeptidase n=1 Tax=Photobacterium sanguinicancri TaxID=875932 RepID=UPI000B12C3BA|nr:D-alanyl-D-alanine carboxypeptidase [Photobacterium sanguinicancri]